ncbi:MAG: hypothetical protein Q8M53_10810 [Burkholderiales bacterium]|nr:hypothetical protein [Burkholderiales bacterium]
MKRLRTWSLPDPTATARRLHRSSWGEAYWRGVNRRKAIAFHKKRMAGELSKVFGVVPLVRVSLGDAGEPQPTVEAPVVH